MFQDDNHQQALKYYFFLIAFASIAILSACSPGEVPKRPSEQPVSPFQLFVFSNTGEKRLLHQANQSQYEDWLANVDATKAPLIIDKTSFSVLPLSDRGAYADLPLMLDIPASRNLVKALHPDIEIDEALKTEYNLNCSTPPEQERAFLIIIRGKRIIGGTFRCFTKWVYTHPEIRITSGDGQAFLTISQISLSIANEIASALEP